MENEEKKRKGRKKVNEPEDLDDDILPASGLYNTQGDLFYHSTPIALTKRQYERVAEHGINLHSRKTFTIEESVQIFKNWQRFAEENKMKLNKAADYILAKKKERHIILHQEEHRFWPKLCAGLPYRHCFGVKDRAETMLTDEFLKDLDWNDPFPQIKAKFYEVEERDDVTMGKARLLMDKGYSYSHLAEIMQISRVKSRGIVHNLRITEKRDDPVMIINFFETAQSFGFDVEKMRRLLILGDEEKFYRKSVKNVNFDGLCLKLHMSIHRCKEFMKEKILGKIWKEFLKISTENVEMTEEEKEEAAEQALLKVVSSKPALTGEQKLKALEIYCKMCGKTDRKRDLAGNREIATVLRENGITEFQCRTTEEQHLHLEICQLWMKIIENEIFQNLRRKFSFQLKLHILLWSIKKVMVWSRIPAKFDETRFEGVLKSEISNPLASEMTKRFLRDKKVGKWIMDPSPKKPPTIERISRKELAAEAFFLYSLRKFGGKFKFPSKLHHLIIPKSSPSVYRLLQKTLGNLEDNSEYLTSKEVKKTVETASEQKMAVKVKTKEIFARIEDSEDSNEEDLEDVEELIKWSKGIQEKWVEKTKRQVEQVLERADPDKRKKKYRKMDEEGDDERILLSKQLRQQKKTLDRVIRMRNVPTRKFKSREFVSSSSEDSSEENGDVDSDEMTMSDGNSDGPEELEDVKEHSDDEEKKKEVSEDVPRKPHKSKKPTGGVKDSEYPESLEDVSEKKKKKKRRHSEMSEDVQKRDDSEDVPRESKQPSEDVECSESPEDVHEDSRKKKKKREHSENSEDVTTTETTKKRKKRHDSDDVHDPEILKNLEGVPEDVPENVEISEPLTEKRKKKKKKLEDVPDDVTNSDDAPHDPKNLKNLEDVTEKKEKKRKKRTNSDDLQDAEDVPEDVENFEPNGTNDEEVTEKKKKKKKKEMLEDVPEDGTTNSENPQEKKKKRKKRNNSDNVHEDIPEIRNNSEDVTTNTDDPHRNTEASETSEDVTEKRKKKKKRKERHDSDEVPEDVEDSKIEKKKKKNREF